MTALREGAGLLEDRHIVEEHLDSILCRSGDAVQEAMRYAVMGAGQRLRPILALRVARVLAADPAMTLRAASAVELLHCASLIVDDLPCMDNAPLRRNRPALHIEFGEAIAVLAAFALVALAARLVAGDSCFQLRLLATLDSNGLIAGQALDLAATGSSRERNRFRVTGMKTVPLFVLAVEAGSLGAVCARAERSRLMQFGREFGIAYQTMDDYLDGEVASREAVQRQFVQARCVLAPFGDRARELHGLLDYLDARIAPES
jgi:geranylgeranyl pyrophosphate synthase